MFWPLGLPRALGAQHCRFGKGAFVLTFCFFFVFDTPHGGARQLDAKPKGRLEAAFPREAKGFPSGAAA